MGDDWQPGGDEETVKLLRPPAQIAAGSSQLETAATRTEGVAHTKLRAHAIGVERLDSLARDIPVDSASTQVTVPAVACLRVALATAQPSVLELAPMNPAVVCVQLTVQRLSATVGKLQRALRKVTQRLGMQSASDLQ